MKRIDVFDENNDMVAGLVLFQGKWQYAEGQKTYVDNILSSLVAIPTSSGGIKSMRPNDDPQLWAQFCSRSGSYMCSLEGPRDDDDDLYERTTGQWAGEEHLITDEELDALRLSS